MIYKRIEDSRKEKNFTQEQLAKAIGKTREWYGKNLKAKSMSLEDRINICKVLGIPFYEIIENDDVIKEEVERYYASHNKQHPGESDLIDRYKEIIDKLEKQLDVKDEIIRKLLDRNKET